MNKKELVKLERMIEENKNENANIKFSAVFTEMMRNDYVQNEETKMILGDLYVEHEIGNIHIHDKNFFMTRPNCLIHNPSKIFEKGLDALAVKSKPAKHLSVALSHIANAINMHGAEFAGGAGVGLFNVYVAPFCKGLIDKEIRQVIQHFIFQLNQLNVARNYQSAFTSVNMTFEIPDFMKDMPVKYKEGVFGDYEEELKRFTKIFIEELNKGDGEGRPFFFPNTIFYLKKEDVDMELMELVCKNMVEMSNCYVLNGFKYGKNYATSMGCVDGKEVVIYKYKEKVYVESFERMWNKFKEFGIKKYGISEYIEVPELLIFDSKNGFVKVKKIIRNPDKGDWIELKLTNGRSLLATVDHPLLTKCGEVKKIEELTLKDEIPVIYKYELLETKVVDNDYAYMLGLLLCDGNRELTLSVGLDEEELADEYIRIIEKIYGNEIYAEKKYQNRGKKGNYIDVVIYGKEYNKRQKIINEINRLLGGVRKNEKHIPNEVFSWNREAKISFIAGMIDADGYVKNIGNRATRLEIGSTNKELAIQQMILLQSVGIPTKLYLNKYSKKHNKYRYKIECLITKEIIDRLICKKKKLEVKEGSMITPEYVKIKEINFIGYRNECSYDVETETGYFDVSGIYSHNCRTYLDDKFTNNVFTDILSSGNLSYIT